MAQAPPKASAKELLYSLPSKFDPWVYILFSTKVIVAGLPRKALPRKQAFVDINIFLWLRKQRLGFVQGQPKHFLQMKEVDRTTEAFARMNVEWKVEEAEC